MTGRSCYSLRFLSWSVGGRSHYFCSLPGVLRIIEILLVLIVLILARVGHQVHHPSLCMILNSHTRAANSPSEAWTPTSRGSGQAWASW